MKHERRSKRLGNTNSFYSKLLDLDKFSDSVPSFNFKGDQSIKTGLGAFCSITISIVVFYYALLKFLVLSERQNPTIATFPVDTEFDKDNPLDLNEINFKVAFQFSVFNHTTDSWKILNDPNYVKAITSMYGFDKAGEYYEKIIAHHECTEEEYSEFHPIASSHEQML